MKAIFKRIKKSVVLTIATIVLLTAVVGGSLAWLDAETGIIKNIFGIPSMETDITENIDGNVKKSVAITNKGDIDVYVRVAVVVTWKNDSGIAPTAPVEGTDYTCNWKYGENSAWVKGADGFYYYKNVLSPSGVTSNLVENVKQADNATVPDGYKLSVEIITQTIQAQPKDAVESAWGVAVNDDGTLNVATSEYAGGITE